MTTTTFEPDPSIQSGRVSKVITSKGGEQFRLMKTGANSAVAFPEGDEDWMVTVDADDDFTTIAKDGLIGEIIDGAKVVFNELAKMVVCKPHIEQKITLDASGRVRSITTVTTCK